MVIPSAVTSGSAPNGNGEDVVSPVESRTGTHAVMVECIAVMDGNALNRGWEWVAILRVLRASECGEHFTCATKSV